MKEIIVVLVGAATEAGKFVQCLAVGVCVTPRYPALEWERALGPTLRCSDILRGNPAASEVDLVVLAIRFTSGLERPVQTWPVYLPGQCLSTMKFFLGLSLGF